MMKITSTLLRIIALIVPQFYSFAEEFSMIDSKEHLFSSNTIAIKLDEKLKEVFITSGDGGIISTTSPICKGSAATLTLSGHIGNIQWQDFSTGVLFSDIAGASTPTYVTDVLNANKWYRVKVSSGNKISYSDKVEVSIVNPPSVQTISGSANASQVCTATAPGYTLNVPLNTLGSTPNFILYKDGQIQTSIGVTNGSNYQFTGLKDVGVYTVKAHVLGLPTCKSDMIGTFKITSSQLPNNFIISGGAAACEDTTASADIYISGSEIGVNYSLSNTTQTKVGTGSLLVFSMAAVASNNNTYTIMARNISTGCEKMMIGTATIIIRNDCNLNGSAAAQEVAMGTIQVYPNPANSQISVSMPSDHISEIDIADINGKTWTSNSVSHGEKYITVDVSKLTKGLYLLTLKGKETVIVTKFHKL